MFDRHNTICVFRDMYRDAHGFRPNHIDFNSMTDEDLNAEISKLDAIVESQISSEKEEKKLSENIWNSRIQKMMIENNIDRATAIRWDIDAENAKNGDVADLGFYCFLLNIRYELANEIAKVFAGTNFKFVIS